MKNIIFFITLLSILSGCVSQKVFRYEAEPKSTNEPLISADVAVLPFADKRPDENTDSRGITLIPLVIWGSQNFDVPEKAKWNTHDSQWWFVGGHRVAEHHKRANKKISQWNPREDIAKATAEEVDAANIFARTSFSRSPKGSDLILQGVLNSSNYYGMFYTYGISVLSPLFWALGAPVTVNNNTLDITFILKNRQGTVIWERNYSKKDSSYSSMYYIKEDFAFNEILKNILLEAVEDMRTDLSHMEAPPIGERPEDEMNSDMGSEMEDAVPELDNILNGLEATDEEKETLGDLLEGLEDTEDINIEEE